MTGRVLVRAVGTDEELHLVNDLMAKVHFPGYFDGLEWLESCGVGYPNFLREHTRVALLDGEIAGALRISTETVRLGEARLKMGGLGCVTTAPHHRHKGVARTLLSQSLAYMRRHGYHVSMLFGIPNFYHRFGFAVTLAEYAIVVSAAEAATPGPHSLKTRPAKPGDIRALQKLHNANDAGVACSLLRSTAHITNKWEHWAKHLDVLTTAQGKVVAYVSAVCRGEDLVIEDLGVAEAPYQPGHASALTGSGRLDVCRALLAHCAKRATKEAVTRIRFLLPPPHPFARFLLQYASSHEMRLERNCGGMMALVDVPEALESMIPEWEHALARSTARDMRGEFTLCVDRATHRIRANRGAVDVAPFSGKNKVGLTAGELMHLITGYRHAADILASRRRAITSDAKTLIAALFPKRHPYVWPFDRF